MAFDGEAIKQLFYLVPTDPNPPVVNLSLPASNLKDCCNKFSLKVLATTLNSDPYQNDNTSVLWWYDEFIVSVSMFLQKHNGSAFVDLVPLSNNTYGTYYAYGFFTNSNNEKFVGYQLNWKSIITAHGEGGYRIRLNFTSAIGDTGDVYSNDYCLKTFTSERANRTVRIEYYLNNILGIPDNDYKVKDLGNLNWFNSFRLDGFFGFPKATYESEYIEYDNGQRQWVEDEQDVEYTLKLNATPAFVHEAMRVDIMQADSIFITDYNNKNPISYIKKQVIKSSEYSPNWNKLQSKLATVEVKFKQEYNNLKKLRC